MGGLSGSVGGATPGKYLMGLSAIASDSVTTIVTDVEGEKVRIMPGGNLGFWRYDHYFNVCVVKKKKKLMQDTKCNVFFPAKLEFQ